MMFRPTTFPDLEPADYLERAFLWLESKTDLGLFCAAQNLRLAFEQILVRHGVEPGEYTLAAFRQHIESKQALAANKSYDFCEFNGSMVVSFGCYLGIPDALFTAYEALGAFLETHAQVLADGVPSDQYQEQAITLRALANHLIPHAHPENRLTAFNESYLHAEETDTERQAAWLRKFWGPQRITASSVWAAGQAEAGDLQAAWAQAERAGLEGLGRQVEAAISWSSTVSWHNVPSDLILACLKAGVIEAHAALTAALAKPDQLEGDLESKVKCLAGISQFLPAQEQYEVLAKALAAARTIDTDGWRSLILSPLVQHLPPDARDLFAEAIDIACEMQDIPNRADTLQIIAENLPSEAHDLREKILRAARPIEAPYTYARAKVIHAVAKRLASLEEQRTVLALIGPKEADLIAKEEARPKKSISADDQLQKDLDNLWKSFTRRLGELKTALANAYKDHFGDLAWITVRIPPKAYDLWAQAVATGPATARNQPDNLKALAERLPLTWPEMWSQLWAAIRELDQENGRLYALRGVVTRSPPEARPVLAEAWTIAKEIGDDQWRVTALWAIAHQLPPQERLAVLAEATATARCIANPQRREKALQIVAQASGEEEMGARLGAAWAVRTVGDEQWRRDIASILHTFAAAGRPHLLHALQTLLPALARLGGTQAIHQVAQAIVDTGHTWP